MFVRYYLIVILLRRVVAHHAVLDIAVAVNYKNVFHSTLSLTVYGFPDAMTEFVQILLIGYAINSQCYSRHNRLLLLDDEMGVLAYRSEVDVVLHSQRNAEKNSEKKQH